MNIPRKSSTMEAVRRQVITAQGSEKGIVFRAINRNGSSRWHILWDDSYDDCRKEMNKYLLDNNATTDIFLTEKQFLKDFYDLKIKSHRYKNMPITDW
jgi:hypothetical protein